ncbi:hypothetical protein NLX83_01800 [Allokutzneria sp. A3M-2-11 16]|uniref:hypothetical protein n=1 Tax=Allokutzneria sp. A3M-2-11 16 TaxID=2962043 RepID=UPI0020B79005|nr:hypothetical protein [Allokutzneria sp. A3M-2-11 16]MCP3797983.1 hypothetical protein [Allokutzneria sp. A3M-2-11 16]
MAFKTTEISYVPPETKDYATRALTLLHTFERFDRRLLAHMLAPSNVLALAGLRSMSPYNDRLRFEIDTKQFKKLLASHGFLWLNEQPNVTDPELPSYALINFNVADNLAATYPLETISKVGPVLERSDWGFFGWQAGLDIAIVRAIENELHFSEWLRDWWSPHNIRFGMLLGYPGAAISSFVQAEVSEDRHKHMKTIMIANDVFKSPDVAFVIDEDYLGRADVVSTVDTWRTTLARVYETYSEDALMGDAELAGLIRFKV